MLNILTSSSSNAVVLCSLIYRLTGHVQAGLMKAFWESDNLVDADLKNKLEEHLAVLRDVPDDEKDWHPGSDKQVLDLIHPSM